MTSTMLEGEETPADKMVLSSPDRDRGDFARSAFRNLNGRVARFSQIFSSGTPIKLRPGLLEAVELANINDILLFEVRGLIGVQA